MNHAFDESTSKCVLCGATQGEVYDNIATPECLGPAGHQLRLAGIKQMFDMQHPEAVKEES